MPVVRSASGPGLSHFEHGTHGTHGAVETATHQKTHAQIPAAWASNAGTAHAGPGGGARTNPGARLLCLLAPSFREQRALPGAVDPH